jgi:gluconolactonase
MTSRGLMALLVAMSVAGPEAQRGAAPSSPLREVQVLAIPGVVAGGARWAVAWQGSDNADGLVAAADGGLLFAQEQSSRVRKIAIDGTVSTVIENTHGAGALAIDRAGRVVAVQRTCTDPGRRGPPCTEPTAVAIIHPIEARRTLVTSSDGQPLGRVNDLVVARDGGVYFTSDRAYHLNSRGEVTAVGEGLRPNGIMLSRDERTLYVTNGPTVAVFDVLADGATGNQREFVRLNAGGTGDGLAIDGDGRLYVTSPTGVQVFSEGGTYLGLIPTPRNAISVAFAGRGKRTLFVVGSGALTADGTEAITAPGVRNNAKTIFSLATVAAGFADRAK